VMLRTNSVTTAYILAQSVQPCPLGECIEPPSSSSDESSSEESSSSSEESSSTLSSSSSSAESSTASKVDDPRGDPRPEDTYCCMGDGVGQASCYLMDSSGCKASGQNKVAVFFSNRDDCNAVRIWANCQAPDPPRSRPVCGDAVVQKPNKDGFYEQCDAGTEINSDSLPDRCRRNCTLPKCGDGVVDSNEACDNYPRESDLTWAFNEHPTCNSDCTSKLAVEDAEDSQNLFYMFKGLFAPLTENLFLVRPLIDWNTIFFPFSTLPF